jgi:DNA (cytosine-5)-methyltransferase 1
VSASPATLPAVIPAPSNRVGRPRRAGRTAIVLDLFAGAGGLTQGFHSASGFTTVRAVEIDRAAAASFEATFGRIVHVGSITDWLRTETVPEVDVVIGGPPCQGFSLLGKQDAEDARNGLWHEYARTIVRARPKYFVLENVAAFLRSPQLDLFKAATSPTGILADYSFEAALLNAADFGTPQLRRRAVIIGHHRDLPFPGFPRATHVGAHLTVRAALRGVPHAVTQIDLPDRTSAYGDQTFKGPFRTDELHLDRTYTSTSRARIRCIPEGGGRFDLPERLLPKCWRNHPSASTDVMGRLRWDQPSVTIRTEFVKPEKGRYLHPTENRAITLYEGALIQGFPVDYRWVGSKTSIARQIGNAVPIPLGKAIAGHLATALGIRRP